MTIVASARIKQALAEQWGRREVARVELKLPIPPSVNALYRNRSSVELERARNAGKPLRGRAKTDRYRTWLQGAGAALNEQKPGRVAGPYNLTILIPRKQSRADVSNLEKATSDLLQTHGVIDNDRLAETIFIQRVDWGGEMLVTVAAERRAA